MLKQKVLNTIKYNFRPTQYMSAVMKVGPVHTKKTPTITRVRMAGRRVTDMMLRPGRFLVSVLQELFLRHILLMLDMRHSLQGVYQRGVIRREP